VRGGKLEFKPIPVEKKIEVVYRMIRGENTTYSKRSLSRQVLYIFLERKSFSLPKRGPKFKNNPKDRKIEKLKEKVTKLENSLEEKDREIKRLKERLEPSKEKVRSVERPYCGFEKVYKNGTYKRKSKGFFDRSKQDREKLDEK